MHILDVLDSIRSSALSEYEKGRKFEKLIQAWLLADPVSFAELRNHAAQTGNNYLIFDGFSDNESGQIM